MSPNLKILFVTHNFPPIMGGITLYSWELCHAFSQRGYRVRVLTSAGPVEKIPTEFEVVTFHENLKWRKARRLAIWKPLNVEIQQFNPDVIFLASVHPYGFWVNRAARKYHVPYVVGTHGQDVWRLANRKRTSQIEYWFGRRALENARTVFSVSNHIAALVRSISAKIPTPVVIPNGVNLKMFSQGKDDRLHWAEKIGCDLQNKVVMTSISALQPYKGHGIAIDALAMLRERLPELIFLIAGDGPLKNHLQAQAENLDLTRTVKLLGALPHDALPSLLRSSDLFIMINQHQPGEGFGLVFLEANACGLPVIAGRSGGVLDIVKEGENGLLVDPESSREIAGAIEKLAGNVNLRHAMGEAGLRKVREYDWSRIAQSYSEKLEDIFR